MTLPQCPHIKSSPPVPDIPLSVRRIERFKVVIGPIGIICSPSIRQLGKHRFLENTTRSTRSRHMSHFCHRDGEFEKVGHLAALAAMTDAAGRYTSLQVWPHRFS